MEVWWAYARRHSSHHQFNDGRLTRDVMYVSTMVAVLAHVRSLETLGLSGTQCGVILTPVIVSRLPEDIHLEWARKGAGHESDLKWLLTFLESDIKCRVEKSGVQGQVVLHLKSVRNVLRWSRRQLPRYNHRSLLVVDVWCVGKIMLRKVASS